MPPVVIKIHDNDEDLDDQQRGRKWQFYRNRQPRETGSRDQAPCLCQRSPASPTHPPTLSQGMQAFSTFSTLPTTHTWPHMPSSPYCKPSTSHQTQTSLAWSWIFSLIPVFIGPQAILILVQKFSYRRQSQIWAVKDDTEAESMLPQSGVSCSVRSAAWVPMSVNFLDLEKLSARHHYL